MPNIQLQFRRGTTTEWSTANPTLAAGEMGLDTVTKQFKIGDGTTAWNTLAYGGIQGPIGPVDESAVIGPASATDKAIVTFDGTTGKLIQNNSGNTIGTTGNTVISVTDNTNAALRITQLGTGNALLVEDSTNPDVSPFVIDANGSIVQGATTLLNGMVGPAWAMVGSTAYGPQYQIRNKTNDTSASYILLSKDRAGAIVVSNDNVGTVQWSGFDGTNYISTAAIRSDVDGTPGTNDMPGRLVFSTTADGASTPTERMRIDSAGRVGIGATPSAGLNVLISKSLTGGVNSAQVYINPAIASDVTSVASLISTSPSTQAASFTLTDLRHVAASQNTIGLGSTVTNQIGFYAASTLTGATNNYGFYGNIASGTGRWNLYMNGTAANYFGGQIQLNQDYIEKTFTANSSTAITLDLINGTDQVITLTGSATITMPTAVAGKSFLLKLRTGTGSFTVTWATIKWPGGTAPTITSAASKMDIFSFFSDGTNWYGTTVGQNYTP